uniref:Uncharacterized protein n=1 Tax=Tanacetum cinerariifolium TaxID=118510 RepID=A0A699HQD3_TANCI|nr:hypothetical protein [Tanacetum cinerariifolium]
MELVLEQTQQGTSHEVLVSAEGVEELKRKVKIKSEKKEALLTLKAKTGSIHLLLETKDSILQARNRVKKILLKLNIPDYRSILADLKIYIKMDMERQSVKVKELQEKCIIKAFQVIKSRKLLFTWMPYDFLRLSLSKNQRLIAELEALGQRADAVRHLKAGYAEDMDESE